MSEDQIVARPENNQYKDKVGYELLLRGQQSLDVTYIREREGEREHTI